MLDYAILSEDGRFHSAKMTRLAELIEEYDPYLELRWIPPDQRTDEETPPFCVVHNPPGTVGVRPYVLFYVHETDEPTEVLARIYAGDNWHGSVLARMEYREQAIRAMQKKEREEQYMEAADMFHFLWSNRSKYFVNWVNPHTGEKYKLNGYRRRI